MGRQLTQLVAVALFALTTGLILVGCGEKGEELPPPTSAKIDKNSPPPLKGGQPQNAAPKPEGTAGGASKAESQLGTKAK